MSPHHAKEVAVEEDWGDDVSLIDKSGSFSCFGVSVRVVLGLLFLAAGVGAVVYSVTSAEHQVQPLDKTQFVYSVSQQSKNGNYSVYRVASDDGSVVTFNIESTRIKWIQVAEEKKLYFQMGVFPHVQYSLFVYSNVTYNVTRDFDACTKIDLTYDDFFRNLGLVNLPRKTHLEQMQMHGKVVRVNAYEGEPPTSVTVEGAHPALVLAYSDRKTDVAYRWELFYSRESAVNRVDYWFEDMVASNEDASIFEDLPSKCYQL